MFLVNITWGVKNAIVQTSELLLITVVFCELNHQQNLITSQSQRLLKDKIPFVVKHTTGYCFVFSHSIFDSDSQFLKQ